MQNYAKYFILILLIYSVLIATMCLSFDVLNTLKYSAIDMRNRVVGARVLLEDQDPYYTKWNSKTPEYLVDGRDFYYTLPVSRCTATPSLLIAHIPFAAIDYKVQQIIWLIAQEIMLLLTLFIMAKQSRERHKIILILGFLFIFSSFFWRFHTSNGQIYIFFTFLIALSYHTMKLKFRFHEFLAGFILGITATWRPPLIIMGLPFLVYKKWKLMFGSVCGIVVGFLSSLVFSDLSTWSNYFSAMKIHDIFHVGLIKIDIGLHPNFNSIEGLKNTFFSADLPGMDSSFQNIFFKHFDLSIVGSVFILALAVLMIFFSYYLFRKRKAQLSIEHLFLLGTTLVLFSEFFLPAARLSYNNVIWLLPLSFIIMIPEDLKQIFNWSLVLLLVGLFSNYMYRINVYTVLVADYSVLIYIILMMFHLMKDRFSHNHNFNKGI